jgi:hypothetical protein
MVSASRWLVGSSRRSMSGASRRSLQSATRRRSPPERVEHVGVVGRAAQRLHGDVDAGVEVPQVLRVDEVLEARHLVRGLVGVVHGELVVAVEDGLLGLHALHDVAADVELLVERGSWGGSPTRAPSAAQASPWKSLSRPAMS